MRKSTTLFLLLLGAAGCRDSLTTSPIKAPTAGPRKVVTPQLPSHRGYWRSNVPGDRQFWVYDTRPGFGMNNVFGEPVFYTQLGKIHPRIIRTTVYWNIEDQHPYHLSMMEGLARGIGARALFLTDEWKVALNLEAAEASTRAAQIYIPYRDHMLTLMDRYPDVSFWQLGNEPDAGCDSGAMYNGWTNTSAGRIHSSYFTPQRFAQGWNYAEMLKIVYPAMKEKARAAGREVWIVTAGFTGEEAVRRNASNQCVAGNASLDPSDPRYGPESWEFLRGIYANGGGQYFDILAIHTYGETPGGQNSVLTTSNRVINLLHTTLADPNRPLWITELGTNADHNKRFLVDDGPANDTDQADQLHRDWYRDALSIQQAQGYIPMVLGYTLRTEEGGAPQGTGLEFLNPTDYSFGLVRQDPMQTRPAFDYIRDQATYLRSVVDAPTQEGHFVLNTTSYIPEGYRFEYQGGNMLIDQITVTAPAPTVLKMLYPFSVTPAVQGLGWIQAVGNDGVAGTVGQSRNLYAFRWADVEMPGFGRVCISTRLANGGSTNSCGSGHATTNFTAGDPTMQSPIVDVRAYAMYAPYKLCYQVHVAYEGWLPEVCEAVDPGAAGRPIQAIRFRLYPTF